jgi:alkylation response protein AidB-like acyl-CoA dehydrogenase
LLAKRGDPSGRQVLAMNFALSDEQEFLREAARGALSRVKTVEAARDALEGGELPDLWPTVVEAGWPGLLVAEEHGGAGLGAFDAMLVVQECGRVLAGVPLLGLLPASALLQSAADESLPAVAAGDVRPAWLPARPPGDLVGGWTVDARVGKHRAPAPRAIVDGDRVSFSGEVAWVPDAAGADLLVVVGADEAGAAAVGAVEAGAAAIDSVTRYDATRSLAHVALDGAAGRRLAVSEEQLARAWYLAQALLAAESLGAVEATLEMAVQYAKERFTFGRAIGSYQAIKHGLTEVLRRQENARSLLFYAGWAFDDQPDQFPLAASAARSAAGAALDYASRQNIATHGGIGATWEHDAPLFFRRAQLTRRLLGGAGDATDRVAAELLAAA